MQEEWKNIYNNFYAVSNLGNVRANERDVQTKTGIRHYKEKILKPEITADGHLRVVLSASGEKERIFIHRLVAENFIPNPDNLPTINHKDEDPSNNKVDNLEWCTVSYNNNYNDRNKKIGDKEGYNINIFNENCVYIESFPSITKAAIKYNISLTTLWRRVKDKKPINGYYFIEQK